jgi:hypothetical protein
MGPEEEAQIQIVTITGPEHAEPTSGRFSFD